MAFYRCIPFKISSVLPSGYQECEYLESTGTQKIDLTYGFDPTDEIYLKSSISDTTNDRYMLCESVWNDAKNRFALGGVYGTLLTIGYGYQGTSYTILLPKTTNDKEVHEYTYSNYLFKCTDLNLSCDVSSIVWGATTKSLCLFWGYNACVTGKLYAYTHKKNGEDIANLIPCLDADKVPCLYDTVSKTTFYNSGTGTFNYKLKGV